MAVCKHSVLRVKAGQWSVVHLLRQREMEIDSHCVERLGCKIARTVILQVLLATLVRMILAF